MGMMPTSFGGRQMDGSYRPQATFMSPQFIKTESETRHQPPSVFEDESRLACDLSVTDGLLEATKDASAMVRYEAVISLARAVEKYLPAFVALAHNLAMHAESRERESPSSQNISADSTGAKLDKSDAQASGRQEDMGTIDTIPMPRGVEHETLTRFTQVWKTLRYLQRQDPFPEVASAANLVVSFVNEHILRIKMDQAPDQEGSDVGSSSTGLVLPSIKSDIFNRSPTGVLSGEHGSSQGQDALGLRSLLSSPSISNHEQQEPVRTGTRQNVAFNSANEACISNASLRRISSELGELQVGIKHRKAIDLLAEAKAMARYRLKVSN